MNQPKLRFKEFTGEWKTVKLKDVGTLKSGYGFPDSEQNGSNGIPFFKVSDMKTNANIMKKANHYVNDNQIDNNNWTVIDPKNGAVIFAKVGAALLKDRKRYVKQPFLMDNNLMSYQFDDSWDPLFGLTLFKTIKLPKYAQTGALPSFNASDIGTIKVNRPSLEEQHKIGEFFSNTDKQIELQEQKTRKLLDSLKGYYQSMFPKGKNKEPEVRLGSFNNNWTTKNLTNLVKIRTGNKNVEDNVPNGKYVFFDRSPQTKYLNTYDYDGETIVYAGEDSKAIPFLPRYYKGKYSLHQRAYGLYDFDGVDPIYLYHYLMTVNKTFIRYSVGTTAQSLRRDTFEHVKVPLPSLEEQKIIGEFFENIDQQIRLETKKLAHLMRLKKGYLQKMFI